MTDAPHPHESVWVQHSMGGEPLLISEYALAEYLGNGFVELDRPRLVENEAGDLVAKELPEDEDEGDAPDPLDGEETELALEGPDTPSGDGGNE